MSAHTAESQFTFELPSMSYIDAKWEEPSLRVDVAAPKSVRKAGLAAWLAHQVAAFVAWRRDNRAADELAAMSDRDLMDIGLARADVVRVFHPAYNEDLRQRGLAI